MATRHSGFPDQVKHGKNGYLANEGDPADFADKVLEYINHAEHWSDMSDAARAHALENYDKVNLIGKQIALYERIAPGVKKLALFIGVFPAVSETFIINQVADLIDRGIDVQIYAFERGNVENVSDRYHEYRMEERVHWLHMPIPRIERIRSAVPRLIRLFLASPLLLVRTLNVLKYGTDASSLKNLFRVEPLLTLDADIVHCHFGTIAVRYLFLRDILRGYKKDVPLVVSFHGYDVSRIPLEKGRHFYEELQKAGDAFLVHSKNMKERVMGLGFDSDKIEIIPVSIDVGSFPFSRRTIQNQEVLHFVSVGRFVEKKGFDDLLRVMAILKEKMKRPFVLHIIGSGTLGPQLRATAQSLKIDDIVRFEGAMKVQDVVTFLMSSHLYVQSSKTAKNGDME